MFLRKALKILKWSAIVFISFLLLISGLLFYFKEDIKFYALNEVNKHINKQVKVKEIGLSFWRTFPNVALSFDDVLVYSKFDTVVTQDTAVYAQNIYLKFNVLDIFKGKYDVHQIDVRQAQVNFRVLENNQVNYDFFKPSTDSVPTPFSFNLEKINLKNVDFTYNNEASKQFYAGYFNDLHVKGAFNEQQFILDANTNFIIKTIQNKSLTFIKDKEAETDISILIDRTNNIFKIQKADLYINKLPFAINGKITQDSLNFYISSNGLSLVDVTNNFLLEELDNINKINGKGTVDFNLFIKGAIDTVGTPSVSADFNIKNGSLSDNGFNISQINLDGRYNNGASGKKELIQVSNIHFFTLNEHFNGNFDISEFEKPRIKGKAKGTIDLKAVHRLFNLSVFDQLAGSANTNSHFDFKLNQPDLEKKDITLYSFKSDFELKDVHVKFKDNDKVINAESGKIAMDKQFVKINDLTFRINKSQFNIDGTVNYITDYFNGNKNLLLNLVLNSKVLDIDDLIEHNNTEKTNEKSEVDYLLPDNIDANIRLNINTASFSGHRYSNVKGRLIVDKRQLIFPNIEVENAKIKIHGNFEIAEKKPMYFVFKSRLNSNKFDIRRIFNEWDNFGQTMITSQNIEGITNVTLNFNGAFDLEKGELLKDELDVNAKISFASGALKNVETFKGITSSMRNSATKLLLSNASINRFEEKLLHLKFESFENEITIKNSIITIPKMTLKSNAIDFNLKGTHTFDNQIDYNFDFRFRDIKGDEKSEFGKIIDDGTGFRIFLKMFGDIDDPNFKWDRETQEIYKQEKKEQAKKDFKSAVRTGFGINKKDTTIPIIQPDEIREDKIIFDFQENDEQKNKPEKEKKGFFRDKIEKWKQDKETEGKKNETQFELEKN